MPGKIICLCHDIERGLGHRDVDPNFARLADKTAQSSLEHMLKIEKEIGVKATYNVVGCFINEIRGRIEKDGHCIAFHSYDHKIEPLRRYPNRWNKIIALFRKNKETHYRYDEGQLAKCRNIDYRIKGYRPPQSKITPELSDDNLCYHNFEWLASSAYSLKEKIPIMQNRIVKIPILFDDFDMYKNNMPYEEWAQKAVDTISKHDFVAFCLHDCYAQYWLPHYREFLKKIQGLRNFKTMDEIADEVGLSQG